MTAGLRIAVFRREAPGSRRCPHRRSEQRERNAFLGSRRPPGGGGSEATGTQSSASARALKIDPERSASRRAVEGPLEQFDVACCAAGREILRLRCASLRIDAFKKVAHATTPSPGGRRLPTAGIIRPATAPVAPSRLLPSIRAPRSASATRRSVRNPSPCVPWRAGRRGFGFQRESP